MYNAGAIAGPLIGGFIGEQFGLRNLYLFSAISFLLSTLMIFFIRRQEVEPRQPKSGRDFFSNRRYVIFLAVVFIAIFAMYLPQPLTSNFLQNQRGVSVREIGILGSVSSLGNVLLTLGMGFFHPGAGLLLGQIAMGVFALLLWRTSQFQWYALGYLLMGGYRAARAMISAQIGTLISKENMGLAFGITETVGGIAIILAPPLAGLLYDRDPLLVFQVTCGAIIIAVMVSFLYYLAKNQQQVPVQGVIDG